MHVNLLRWWKYIYVDTFRYRVPALGWLDVLRKKREEQTVNVLS